MSNNIEGKVVVITGASSGNGEATARHLSGRGATVVLGARRADRIKSLADELNRNGGKHSPCRLMSLTMTRSRDWSTQQCRHTAGSTS